MSQTLRYNNYCFCILKLFLELLENFLKVLLLILHGLSYKFKQFVINIIDLFIMSLVLGASISEHDLDNVWELLLKYCSDELPRLAFWDLNSRFWTLILLLFYLISDISVLFTLPCEVIFKEEAHES